MKYGHGLWRPVTRLWLGVFISKIVALQIFFLYQAWHSMSARKKPCAKYQKASVATQASAYSPTYLLQYDAAIRLSVGGDISVSPIYVGHRMVTIEREKAGEVPLRLTAVSWRRYFAAALQGEARNKSSYQQNKKRGVSVIHRCLYVYRTASVKRCFYCASLRA